MLFLFQKMLDYLTICLKNQPKVKDVLLHGWSADSLFDCGQVAQIVLTCFDHMWIDLNYYAIKT